MRTICVAAVITTIISPGARADLITFENVVSHGNLVWSSLVSGGYRFTSSHFHVLDDHTGLADDGTTNYIGSVGGGIDHAITMTKLDGSSFDVLSFDGAELFQPGNMLTAFYPNATSIRLTASFAAGGSTTMDFALDGIVDGAGGAADFQHFNVNGLTGLSSLVINGVQNGAGEFAFAVDSINAAAIPTPASATIGAIGLLCLVVHRSRWDRRSRTS